MKGCCVLICLLTSILCGCIYEPDGHYINPNVYPPLAQIPASINIDDIEEEYALVIPTYFTVKIDRAGKFLKHFNVTKDGQAVYLMYSSTDAASFHLDPANLPDGTHEYDIEMVLSSGSRSLAEAAGLEDYVIQKKLVVNVDRSEPAPVSGLTAAMVNGKMVLTWDKPAHKNFYYSIYRYNEATNKGASADIRDPNVTEFVDEGFLGGKAKYYVSLRSAFFDVTSESPWYEHNFIEATSQIDEDDRVIMKWVMSHNFGEDVFVHINGRRFEKDFPATNAGEAIVDSLFLGDVANSTVQLLRRGFEDDGVTLSFTSSVGDKLRPFYECSFIKSSNKLLLHRGPASNKTYRYDATTLQAEDSFDLYIGHFPRLSSPDGQRQWFLSHHTLYGINPMNLADYPTQINLSSIYYPLWNRDLGYTLYHSISNNDLIVFTNSFQNGQQIDYKIVTVDLNTKQLWGSEIDGVRAFIAEDASFLAATNQVSGGHAVIYKRGLNDWEELGKIPNGEIFFSRLPNPRLISSLDGITRVYNLDSAPNAEGFFIAAGSASIQATGFDIVNDRILSETIDAKLISTISIYSVDDFQLVSTVKARVAKDYLGPNHIVIGGRHLVISGFITDIE